ncbi:unnamed protein product [Somion occarium]|uniref:Rho termination factor N-terminal domain-containing protein n=1 Tax=Somion occarium TaxID=3059160 RepID=A0ABP1DYD7_9APHY
MSDSLAAVPTNGELAKLTVKQLRALCKEKKLTGYAKLSKPALLQMLGAFRTKESHSGADSTRDRALPCKDSNTPASERPASTTNSSEPSKSAFVPNNDAPIPGAERSNLLLDKSLTGASRPRQSLERTETAHSSTLSLPTNRIKNTSNVRNVENIPPSGAEPQQKQSQNKSSMVPRPTDSSPDTELSTLPYSKNALKRPGPLFRPLSSIKKSKTAHTPSSSSSEATSVVVPSVNSPSSVFPSRPVSVSIPVTPKVPTRGLAVVNQVRASPAQTLKCTGQRFKPLVINKPLPKATSPSAVPNDELCASSSNNSDFGPPVVAVPAVLHYLDLPPPADAPTLKPITMPPSLSQRKRVQQWAIVLSDIRPADRRSCCLVCRMIRYALYLSASPILQRKFPGKRLEDVSRRYSPTMSNMWPYLRLRQDEIAERRKIYHESFLSRIFKGRNPIAISLWASGNHENQLRIALRFVLTRLWFSISFNSQEHETWLHEKVIDVQEVVPNHVWSITVQRAEGRSAQVFHVLEATCEVVGRARQLSNMLEDEDDMLPIPLRADWSEFIHHQSSSNLPLEANLKWAHYEEYDKGVSRLWLKRIAFEGEVGAMKRLIAERYVLASVIANSISGRWMSTAQMAQEFAGLPSRMDVTDLKKVPQMNLFVPAHHHVESVHFTTAKHIPLHPALAVIQTPDREYFVLRDNGMEIGCEEEGIRDVWMQMLQCNNKGLPL